MIVGFCVLYSNNNITLLEVTGLYCDKYLGEMYTLRSSTLNDLSVDLHSWNIHIVKMTATQIPL